MCERMRDPISDRASDKNDLVGPTPPETYQCEAHNFVAWFPSSQHFLPLDTKPLPTLSTFGRVLGFSTGSLVIWYIQQKWNESISNQLPSLAASSLAITTWNIRQFCWLYGTSYFFVRITPIG